MVSGCLEASALSGGTSGTTAVTNTSTVTFNGVSQPVNTTNVSTVTFGGTPQQVYQSTSGVYASTVSAVILGQPTINAVQSGVYTVTPGTGTWAISGSVTANNGPISILVNTSTQTIGYGVGLSSVPVNVLNTVTITGSISNTGFNFNNLPAVTTVTFNGFPQPVSQSGAWGSTVTFNGAQPVTQSGVWGATITYNGTQTVNAQEVSGTRWSVSFSTAETTAVLSSTYNVVSVAISSPIAAVGGQTVRVFRLIVTVDAATTINFRDGTNNFGDSYPMLANGSIVLDLTNEPWYITSTGNAFVIKQSGSANISYAVYYTQS
jgi:hypothetical protein